MDEQYLLKVAADLKAVEDEVATRLWAKQRELGAIDPDRRHTAVTPRHRKRVVELVQDIALLQILSVDAANARMRIHRFVDWLNSSEKQSSLPLLRAVTS